MTTPRRAAAIAAAFLALIVAAGCGDDTSGSPAPAASATGTSADQRLADPAAGAMIAGPTGPNIAEVLADRTGEPVVAAGYLFIDRDGSARLCASISGSSPRECGAPSIPVTDLEPDAVGVRNGDGVQWSEGLVQLIGRVKDGTFVNDPALLAAS